MFGMNFSDVQYDGKLTLRMYRGVIVFMHFKFFKIQISFISSYC